MKPEANKEKPKSLTRQRQYIRRSKLDKYADKLVLLRRDQHLTYTELQAWLKKHRITVETSTIIRWFREHYGSLC